MIREYHGRAHAYMRMLQTRLDNTKGATRLSELIRILKYSNDKTYRLRCGKVYRGNLKVLAFEGFRISLAFAPETIWRGKIY